MWLHQRHQSAYMALRDLWDSDANDPSQVPSEWLSTTPHLESISFSVNDIVKLMNDLNPHKAAIPDQIRPLVPNGSSYSELLSFMSLGSLNIFRVQKI